MSSSAESNAAVRTRVGPVAWLTVSAAVLGGLLVLQLSSPRQAATGAGEVTDARRGQSADGGFSLAEGLGGWTFDPLMASPAYGDVVAKVGDQTLLTFNAGSDDVLAILDSRSEQILAYRVRNQTNLELIGVYALPDLFVAGQRLGAGTGGGGRGR